MKNKEKLQNNFSWFQSLIRQAEELREEIEIQADEYLFCCHFNSTLPLFHVWAKDMGSANAAAFEINDGNVSVSDAGRYDDATIHEMKKIIKDWLNGDE